MTETEFKSQLKQFTGSESLYPYLLGTKITEGVKFACETAKCFWFADIIASYQMEEKFKAEYFQLWRLQKTGESTAVVVAEDGNKNELVRQEIPFTDFKFSELTYWCVDKVIMLSSEY